MVEEKAISADSVCSGTTHQQLLLALDRPNVWHLPLPEDFTPTEAQIGTGL